MEIAEIITNPEALSSEEFLEASVQADAENSLYEFTKQAWHVLEPANPFQDSDVIRAWCMHLEAVTAGKIRKLAGAVPPGFCKSLTTCVMWQAWEWIKKPDTRWLFVTYSDEFAMRDSMKCRDLIKSKWYQDRWGDRYRIRVDQDSKSNFGNNAKGFRFSTSIAGGGTGSRTNRIIIDDGLKIEEAYNETARNRVNNWFDQVGAGRGVDPRTSSHVIIQQRLHPDDLIGHVQKQGGFVYFFASMRFNPNNRCTTPIWQDPRTETGMLCWPERFTEDAVSDWEKRLGLYGSASQLGQDPQDLSGGLFRHEFFNRTYKSLPPFVRLVRYWDKASVGEAEACYTVGVLMGMSRDKMFYVEDVVRGKWYPTERDAIILQTAKDDRKNYGIGRVETVQEAEGGSSGKDVALAATKLLAGFSVWQDHVTRSKPERAIPFASQCGGGTVYLKEDTNWRKDFVDELVGFPLAKFKDQVDAASGACNWLIRGSTGFSVSASAGGAGSATVSNPSGQNDKMSGFVGTGKADGLRF